MKLLLDTHVWLWWLATPEKLGVQARRLIGDRRNEVYLSAVSSWEIAIKHSLGRLNLGAPPQQFVPDRMARDGIAALPILHSHALEVATLPRHHRDPFDRMLVAQSRVESMPLVTADVMLEKYDVELLTAGA